MESEVKWKMAYQNEINHALLARKAGNEGMARVCARRAAGIVIGEYLSRQGYTNLSKSAVERMSIFLSLPTMDEHTRNITSHFMVKVNPDHNLPEDVDLISDAQWLITTLLLENID
jgi:hypothetical protein